MPRLSLVSRSCRKTRGDVRPEALFAGKKHGVREQPNLRACMNWNLVVRNGVRTWRSGFSGKDGPCMRRRLCCYDRHGTRTSLRTRANGRSNAKSRVMTDIVDDGRA